MEPIYVGQIMLWAGTWVPEYFLPCDGRAISIMQYQALYSILLNTYGGNAQAQTFNLPKFSQMVLAGTGQGPGLINNYALNTTVTGAATATVSQSSMPVHTHAATLNATTAVTATLQASGSQASTATPSSALVPATGFSNDPDGPTIINLYGPQTSPIGLTNSLQLNVSAGLTGLSLAAQGGGVAHSNVQPYLCMYYIIATQGNYPIFP